MRYKLLGNSGLRVSELCLGTMTFGDGSGWLSARAESLQMLETFAAAGGNFIDTANLYAAGRSEEIVGEFLHQDRARFVVATKYSNAFPGTHNPNVSGNSRKCLTDSLDASLKRMELEYIDVYWLHVWDHMTPIDEVMRALDDAVRAGKIMYVGFSNTPAWVIARANTMAELLGWSRIVALQLEYSLVERSIERELLPMARALDITLTAWSPLASGLLSGKYTRTSGEQSRRKAAGFDRGTFSERNLGIARAVDRVADELGCSSAAVALSWLRAKGVIPVLGARTLQQLQENLSCERTVPDARLFAELDAITAIEPGHPYNMHADPMVQAIAYGGFRERIDPPDRRS